MPIIWQGAGAKHKDYIYKEKESLRVVTDSGGKDEKEAVFSIDNIEAAWEFINKAMRRRLCKEKPVHCYGIYKWVRLTDEQYERLCTDYGELELKKAIDYIDEQAQITSNKNKWKDWNLVLRRCLREHWTGIAEETKTEPGYDIEEFNRRAERLPVYMSNKMRI